MTEFNYGDIIEYIDKTLDENFNKARKWAKEHNTSFEELVNRRDLPKRYFQIGEEPPIPSPEPLPPEPTEDELKEQTRQVRNSYLSYWDFTQLIDAPFTEEEKAIYREYRQYLRDYTKQDNWWLQYPDDYETWLVTHYPVTGE